jgi:DNA-binding transcriptional LysR family regulator
LLYTSQPAVSAQVKALEEELGVTLFERGPRGMTLTRKGELLYAHAVATLDAAARLKTEAVQLQQTLVGELRIGVHTDFGFLRIGDLHGALQARNPQVRLHFVQSMTADILADVRRGRLDAGFFFGPCRDNELAVLGLAGIAMRVIAPAAWADRVRDAAPAQLADLPWVYTSRSCPFFTLTEALLAPTGSTPDRIAFADSEDAVRELVCGGAGLSIVRADDASRLAATGRIAVWSGPVPSIELGLAVKRQQIGQPLIDTLRRAIAAMWPGDTGSATQAGL